MAKHGVATLDRTFAALSDANRRSILDRLGDEPSSISQLAAPLHLSLPGVLKHVRVLEEAGLVETFKDGRTRWCQLRSAPLGEVSAWVADRQRRWESALGAPPVSPCSRRRRR